MVVLSSYPYDLVAEGYRQRERNKSRALIGLTAERERPCTSERWEVSVCRAGGSESKQSKQ